MELPAVRPYLDLQPGATVRHGERFYVIQKALDFDNIVGEDFKSKEHKTLPIAELEPPFLEEPLDRNAPEFAGVSDGDWKIAEERCEAIRPLVLVLNRTRADVEERAKKCEVSTATFYRWLIAFEKTLRLSSLLPKQVSEAKDATWLLPRVEEIIQEAIKAKYKKKGKRQISAVVKEVETCCNLEKLPVPAKSTIRDRVLSIPGEEKIKNQLGPRKARDLYRPAYKKFPGANTPHAVWQIDHTQLRQEVLNDKRTGSAGRPWATVAIDVNSTVVPGFFLSLDPPSTCSVGICLAQAILRKEQWLKERGIDAKWPVWGEPGTVHADNAGEFRGEMLRAATLDLDMRLEWRPVKHPSYGAHIESMCGTLKEFLDGQIPGTGSRDLKYLQEYDPDKEAVMTLSELEAYIAKYLLKIYHMTPKVTLGNYSPMQMYEAGIFGDDKRPGIGLPVIRKNERDLRIQFLPREEVTVQQYGIRWDVNYFGPELRRWIRAKDAKTQKTRKFFAHRDDRDVSIVYFYDSEDRVHYDIPFADSTQPKMTLHELRLSQQRVRSKGGDVENDAEVFKAYAELNRDIENATTETKMARKEKMRAKYAKKGAARDQQATLNRPPPRDEPSEAEQLAVLDFEHVEPFTED